MDGMRQQATARVRAFFLWLTVLVGLVATSGASCSQMARRYLDVPRVLPPGASLQQVIDVVNGNSGQIQSFVADRATIQLPNAPRLRASVALQRPRRFRLRAETALSSGAEVDLGSNDELFWFWYQRAPQKAVYVGRHDQFAQGRAVSGLPITPVELIEALGLVEFDPALPHQGPVARPDGLIEVRTIRDTPQGPSTRIVVVDPVRGWVVQQHVLDTQNQLVASATASGHRRDPLSNLVLPRVVQIDCPAAQFSMRIDLGNVAINTLGPDRDALWTMPAFPGAQRVDLSGPGVPFQPARRPGRDGAWPSRR